MTNDAQTAMIDASENLEAMILTGTWVVIGILVVSFALMIAKPVMDTMIERSFR